MTSQPAHPRAATGLAHAGRALPRLAADAVEQALSRLGDARAGQVLLFLSSDFAQDPQPAIVAAARAGQTLAVSGCTALGVFSDDDWLLDTPAACALVLSESPAVASDSAPRLALAAPNTVDLAWLEDHTPRYGGIAGDVSGMGPYKVWRQGRVSPEGRCELRLPAPSSITLSRALMPVSQLHQITDIAGFDLKGLDGRQAAATLIRAAHPLPPLHELALATFDQHDQLQHSAPLVSINPDGAVTVAARLFPGQRVRWMRHTAEAASDDMNGLSRQPAPAFALVFSCGGRGAALHDGLDREWQALRRAWPFTPFAGFYGNGQIAPVAGSNQLLHRSVVVAGFG
jgi:small ligand-binding sensory domain FIST